MKIRKSLKSIVRYFEFNLIESELFNDPVKLNQAEILFKTELASIFGANSLMLAYDKLYSFLLS